MEQFFTSLFRFWYTVAIVFILSRFIYYRYKGKKEYLFTFILLAAIVFFICILISKVELSLGFAFGIFAIFGIIRYRTAPIPPREMTYILLSAGIAAINGILPIDFDFYKILITDLSILVLAGGLEFFLFNKEQFTKEIIYNNLDLIHPEKRDLLYSDLNQKYGLTDIEDIKVGKIDMVKNSVRLIVTFKDPRKYNFTDE